MNPNHHHSHSCNRRQRARNYRGSADPYPVHHNIFIQQHLDQERRRQNMRQPNQRQFFVTRPDMNFFFNYATMPASRSAAQAAAAVHFDPNEPNVSYTRIRISAPATPITEQTHSAARILQMCINLIATERDANDTCSICIANFIRGQSLHKLPCNHKFHTNCIRPWFERTTVCPLCRADFLKSDNLPATAYFQDSAPGPIPHLPMQNVNITHYYNDEPVAHIEISSESENEEETNNTSGNVPQPLNVPRNNKA